MGTLAIVAILLTITVVAHHINQQYLRQSTSIGILILSFVGATVLALLQWLGFSFVQAFADNMLSGINLDTMMLQGFLCLLLFVGALHVDLKALQKEWIPITLLATGGVLISTLIVGGSFFALTSLFGISISLWYCLAFGALNAPTDAVVVLAFLKNVRLPAAIESKITGESLLNDGMSIVLFTALLGFALGNTETSLITLPFAVAWDILGGIVIGSGLGYIALRFLVFTKGSNRFQAIQITLALATGSFALAHALGASGPIASVFAGLLIGNPGPLLADDVDTKIDIADFWENIDEILNSCLAVIIGLELLSISTQHAHLAIGVLAVPMVLFGRYASVSVIIKHLKRYREFTPKVRRILTWGGLRGGVSIALVLSLPAGEVRDVLMTATYFVVLFSILVQGTTLPYLIDNTSDEEVVDKAAPVATAATETA